MTQIETLSGRQKLTFGMINNEYVSAGFILAKMQKIDPKIKINAVADILLKLTTKKLTKRKKINMRWHYKLAPNTSSIEVTTIKEKAAIQKSANNISKSFDKQSINTQTYNYLRNNIGRIVSANTAAESLKLEKIPSTIYTALKNLHDDGFLLIASRSPKTYEVLPSMASASESRPKAVTKHELSPARTVIADTTQAELFETQPQALPDFQNLNMGDTINSILQLQQQVTVYKSALEHIASILEQAGIIESE
jgi:Fe2+ or Zn2+ uptake regulation protein